MFRLLVSDGRGGTRAVQVPRWAVWAGSAGLIALAVLFVTLSLTLLLVLAPIGIVAGLVARWRLKKALRQAGGAPPDPFAQKPQPDGVIDVEYRIIDDQRDR
jgi:hypothetical protein